MNMIDDGYLYHRLEMRKRELMSEAKIHRLARTIRKNPSRIQQGWMRLIADFLHPPPTNNEQPVEADPLNDRQTPIDVQLGGPELI